uniref:Uncharacterized protein n=1 Tax=Triticum urartu TaxID=4572 RepID=A0A8R7Q158_TRIUA
MARFRASDLLPVAMSLSSSSHPTCGEERPVDNLATAQDEAATSFLLRLQVSSSTPPSALVRGRSREIFVLEVLGFSTAWDQVPAR